MRDDENSRRSSIINPSSTFSSFYSVSKIKMHCSNLLDYKKYKYSFFQVIIKNVDKYSSHEQNWRIVMYTSTRICKFFYIQRKRNYIM